MISAVLVGLLTALAARSPARWPPWVVAGVGALLAAGLGYAEHWAGLP